MARLFFKVFDENDFQENMNGQTVSGFITRDGNKQPGIVQLGKEVENLEKYRDNNTEYRKFTRCNLYVSITEEDAQSGDYGNKIEGLHTITIFY